MTTPRVPITRPQLMETEVEAVSRVVRSGWLTQGPEVAAFETEFAKTVGAAHAVAVSNCTVALELALRVADVRPGDDVVTVSHSFIATANSIVSVGARPVFADIDPLTYGMSGETLRAALTPKTRAILCVHQIGIPCDLPAIVAVAKERGIPLIEDAACAIGSEIAIDGAFEPIGKPRGLIACFSLHPRKIVTTGDGGMLTTQDAALASQLKLLRQHAMSVPDTVRHHSDKVVFEEYTTPAWNYRLTDLQAAVGRPQLARLPEIVKERRAIARQYHEALSASKVLAPFEEPAWLRSNFQSYPVRIRPGCGWTQVEAMQHLMDAGLACKRGVLNAHQEPAYRDPSLYGRGPSLAASEAARDNTILLPLFHGMSADEIKRVISACLSLTPR